MIDAIDILIKYQYAYDILIKYKDKLSNKDKKKLEEIKIWMQNIGKIK